MAISASIIPSFTAPRSRGIFSSAKNFITGRKPGLESIIENISSPQKSTSNFLTVFGSDKTEEILKKNVITLRNTLLDVFELSRVLVVAIDEISKSLKNLSMNARKSSGGLFGKLLTGGGLLGGGALANKALTKKVTQEGGERVTTQLGKRIIKKTTTSPQATKGIIPKLTNFAKKNKWLTMLGLLGLPFLPWMSGGNNDSGSIDSGSIDKFSSNIDTFAKAVESLKSKSTPVSSDDVTKVSDGKPGIDGSSGVAGAQGVQGKQGTDGIVRIVEPKRSDFPNTRSGAKKFIQARKDYHASIKGQENNNFKQIDNLSVGSNKPIVNVIPYSGMPTQTDSGGGGNLNIPTSSGASPDMPFLSSSKSDNFVTLNSKMIYNIVE